MSVTDFILVMGACAFFFFLLRGFARFVDRGFQFIDPRALTGQRISRFAAWYDRMTYRPFLGAHRGWYYRLPWHRKY